MYVGFGGMRAPKDIARMAIEAVRAQGCRVLVACGIPWRQGRCLALAPRWRSRSPLSQRALHNKLDLAFVCIAVVIIKPCSFRRLCRTRPTGAHAAWPLYRTAWRT